MSNFEETIGYTFKNKTLLKQALTHSSADSGICNERMEFLGDSVLSLVVSKYLYDNLPDSPEGRLTKLRANLVCEEALYKYAKKIGLGTKIIMGNGEERTGGRNRKSILSDAFEALIAAIYLDSGMTDCGAFITPFLPDKKELKAGKLVNKDYKTALQELVQKNPNGTIQYLLTGESGCDHEKIFFSDVLVNGAVKGSGSGKSKKKSQQQAAKAALINYEKN
jgi:ribonuclease-3